VSNVLSEEKKKQVIVLGQLGWSLRRIEIEKTTGIRRETAAAYLKAAENPVRPPGGWGKREPAKPANGVTTDSTVAASSCEPYRELIEQGLMRGRNAMSIWQELVDQHGFAGAYESVKRFVEKQRGTQNQEACAVIITEPGEEAQVDYGTGPLVRDPRTGKYRRTRLFVMTLGFSRKCVRLLSFQSSARVWGELHETAFWRIGGSPKVVVLDNLREGVLTPDIYDAAINPLYRDLLLHYNVVAMPCPSALAKNTGKLAWKVELIVPGADQMTAYDAGTGEKLWWIRGLSWQPKSAPIVDGDIVYAHWWESGGESEQPTETPDYAATLAKFDANQDSKLAEAEFASDPRLQRSFRELDLDSDGFLNARDWDFYRAKRASRNRLIAVRHGGRGDFTHSNVIWSMRKFLPNVPSPLLYP